MLEYGHPSRVMSPGWQFCLGVLLSTVPILFLAIIAPLVDMPQALWLPP